MDQVKTGRITRLKGRERFLFPLLCVLTALIPLLYPEISNGGFYFICDDFCNQMLPFLFNFREAFKNGLNTYYWNYDLGTPMLYGYGYYGIGSIFFYPSLLVPRALLPYMIILIMLMKYLVACYSSFLFIKRFTKTAAGAVPGAILYAFSGLQCTNIVFYIFHDVSALFPFMVLTLDALISDAQDVDGGKKAVLRNGVLFSLAVCINCLTNYVFFVQSVAAVVIYFLFMSDHRIAVLARNAARSAVFGILGVGLSGVVYVPNILYIMGNERSSIGIESNLFFYDKATLLYILKGFLLPGDIMLDESALLERVWLSTSCYLPFVGMIFVFAYLAKKRNRLSALVLFLMIISFIPVGNGFFLLFTIIYHRWWYFLILLMALMSCLVLEEPSSYRISLWSVVQGILICILTALIFLIKGEDGESLIFHEGRLLLLVAFSLLGTAAVLFLDILRRRKENKAGSNNDATSGNEPPASNTFWRTVLLGICACAVVTTLFAEKYYRAASPVEPSDYINIYHAAGQMPDPGEEYRYRNYRNPVVMYNFSENAAGLSSYSSTTSNSIIEFDELFDWWDVSRRTNKNFIPGAAELLGGKYLILTDANTEERYPDNILKLWDDESAPVVFETRLDDKTYKVFELDACPIGYAATSFIRESELRTLPVNMRGIALLNAVVVKDDEKDKVSDLLDEMTAADVQAMINAYPEYSSGNGLFENPVIHEATVKNAAAGLESFERDYYGFRGVSNYSSDSIIYFTIPYDKGWHVTIDGNEASLISSGGMSLLKVPGGSHTIDATYKVPGLTAGILVSLISLLVLAMLYAGFVVSRKRSI